MLRRTSFEALTMRSAYPLHLPALMLTVGVTVTWTCAGTAQEYPVKPVRIVAIGPGGTVDFAARLIAQGLAAHLGQQVVVENRPSGVIPGDIVAKSAPDGYTLLVSGGNHWTLPLLQSAPYDAIKDFAPISLTNAAPNLLVLHVSLPVKSVRELIALAKARPGELNYSSAGTGSTSHLAGAMFNYLAGVNIVRVPYSNGSARMAALIGGEMQLEFSTAGSVAPYLKSGRLRLIAVTSAAPSALFPDVPTVASSGVAGYETVQMSGLWAPARTPAAVIDRLNQDIVRYLGTQAAKDAFMKAGVETVGSTPEQFAATIKADVARLEKVIKAAGIRPD